MRITIGEKIKELRQKKGCTQEELAAVLGITGQAVSRWESGGSYPDLEMIPSLANFFQISIDKLFGYDIDRQNRIEEILAALAELKKAEKPEHKKIVTLLRNACTEFPGDEKLSFELADALFKQGYGDGLVYIFPKDDEYPHFDVERNRDNVYWQESICLFKRLAASAEDEQIVTWSKQNLIYLYHHMGRNEEAVQIAETFPEMCICRENLLASATDGKEHYRYTQELLLTSLDNFRQALIAVMSCRNCTPYGNPAAYRDLAEMKLEKCRGLVRLYELIFDDGNPGAEHLTLMDLYLQMISAYGPLLAYGQDVDSGAVKDVIFDCLDKAFIHAQCYDALPADWRYTAPLLDHVSPKTHDTHGQTAMKILEKCMPVRGWELEKKLAEDPRWDTWCRKVEEACTADAIQ
ncbi:MAG: helix-turn-helix transcriptional regulator [Clostridia bacterium]|nr:helix-turn-helix transcriptional regulator [Clostridia bacterium]